jgi:hypothetical protein
VPAVIVPNQEKKLTEQPVIPKTNPVTPCLANFDFSWMLRESAIRRRILRESATILADYPSYRFQRARINLASNSKSTLRGIEMTLATVAYRISTDVSFAESLQMNAEVALQLAGIALEKTEKKALEALLALPESISKAGNFMLTTEPWAA